MRTVGDKEKGREGGKSGVWTSTSDTWALYAVSKLCMHGEKHIAPIGSPAPTRAWPPLLTMVAVYTQPPTAWEAI